MLHLQQRDVGVAHFFGHRRRAVGQSVRRTDHARRGVVCARSDGERRSVDTGAGRENQNRHDPVAAPHCSHVERSAERREPEQRTARWFRDRRVRVGRGRPSRHEVPQDERSGGIGAGRDRVRRQVLHAAVLDGADGHRAQDVRGGPDQGFVAPEGGVDHCGAVHEQTGPHERVAENRIGHAPQLEESGARRVPKRFGRGQNRRRLGEHVQADGRQFLVHVRAPRLQTIRKHTEPEHDRRRVFGITRRPERSLRQVRAAVKRNVQIFTHRNHEHNTLERYTSDA